MKFVCPAAVLVAFLGIGAPTHARGERGQGGRPQEARPGQQQARPAQQRQQPQQRARPAEQRQQFQQRARPAEQRQQPQRQAGPAAGPPRPTAMPAQQQHTQQAAPSQRQQVYPAGRPQGNPGRNQVRAQQSPPAGPMRGANQHGRISEDHYAAHFGSRHSFHVSRGDYDHRRFWYGGYQFGFIDPWPIGWGYSDDVYVEYGDGGYYMYNRVQPGVRISIDIL